MRVSSNIRHRINMVDNLFIVITTINIVMFILTLGGTNWLTKALGNYYVYTLEQGQYYRLVTCMFIHGGIRHLVFNSISLLFIDFALTFRLKVRDRYILYFVTGVLSSLISAVFHMVLKSPTISFGASGAICGLLGVLIAMLFENTKLGKYNVVALIVLIVLELCNGGNVAHIGGLICGYVLYKLAVRAKLIEYQAVK